MLYYNEIEHCLEFNQDKIGSRKEINEERVKELVTGISQGMSLITGADGYPILQDISQAEKDRLQSISDIVRQKEEMQMRLTELSKDMAQEQAGEIVPNIAERKAEFVRIHNELRVLENKQPRVLRDKINALEGGGL